MLVPRLFAGLLLLASCGCSPYELPPAPRQSLPSRISELRLYRDVAAGTVNDDARAYRPSFTLWSDGASKRRWIRLPPDQMIDTSDMNSWRFPAGTELWKEFSVDGKRIETRVLRKVDDGWAAMTYAWNAEQTEATAAPDGVRDALGTHYDIPSTRTCMACHGGRAERILGFSAIQLSHDAPAEEVTLDRLVATGRVSTAPAHPIVVPGTEPERRAIGYLHANCSHCHNDARPADATYFRPPPTVDFGLRVEDLGAVASTHAYATAARYAMGANPSTNHLVFQRMTQQSSFRRRMPPLATEVIDPAGVALVKAWLETIPH